MVFERLFNRSSGHLVADTYGLNSLAWRLTAIFKKAEQQYEISCYRDWVHTHAAVDRTSVWRILVGFFPPFFDPAFFIQRDQDV